MPTSPGGEPVSDLVPIGAGQMAGRLVLQKMCSVILLIEKGI